MPETQAEVASRAVSIKTRSPDRGPDPVLSPAEMCADAGISLKTWKRVWRHRLPIVRVGRRKIGCRLSNWRAALGEDA